MKLTVLHLTPAETSQLAECLRVAADNGLPARVGFDDDGFKVSVAQQVWTRGFGSVNDPMWADR